MVKKMNRILVMGSDGFIGSYLAEELVKRDMKSKPLRITTPLTHGAAGYSAKRNYGTYGNLSG